MYKNIVLLDDRGVELIVLRIAELSGWIFIYRSIT
jgi:hypothetical protein